MVRAGTGVGAGAVVGAVVGGAALAVVDGAAVVDVVAAVVRLVTGDVVPTVTAPLELHADSSAVAHRAAAVQRRIGSRAYGRPADPGGRGRSLTALCGWAPMGCSATTPRR